MLDINDLFRTDYDREVFNRLPKPSWFDAAAGPKVLDPDPAFIAPSLFSYTLQVNQHAHKILRSQHLADRIMNYYWERVHPVACVVHRPSFQQRYDIFWSNASRAVKETPESTQALVYAALFSGVVSMDAETVRLELGGERKEWVEALEKATAVSLGRAHAIRTEKPETIQAFVMYLVSKASVCKSSMDTCGQSQRRRLMTPPSDSANLVIETDPYVSRRYFPHSRDTRGLGH